MKIFRPIDYHENGIYISGPDGKFFCEVFGDDKKLIVARAKLVCSALNEYIKSDDLSEFIKDNPEIFGKLRV